MSDKNKIDEVFKDGLSDFRIDPPKNSRRKILAYLLIAPLFTGVRKYFTVATGTLAIATGVYFSNTDSTNNELTEQKETNTPVEEVQDGEELSSNTARDSEQGINNEKLSEVEFSDASGQVLSEKNDNKAAENYSADASEDAVLETDGYGNQSGSGKIDGKREDGRKSITSSEASSEEMEGKTVATRAESGSGSRVVGDENRQTNNSGEAVGNVSVADGRKALENHSSSGGSAENEEPATSKGEEGAAENLLPDGANESAKSSVTNGQAEKDKNASDQASNSVSSVAAENNSDNETNPKSNPKSNPESDTQSNKEASDNGKSDSKSASEDLVVFEEDSTAEESQVEKKDSVDSDQAADVMEKEEEKQERKISPFVFSAGFELNAGLNQSASEMFTYNNYRDFNGSFRAETKILYVEAGVGYMQMEFNEVVGYSEDSLIWEVTTTPQTQTSITGYEYTYAQDTTVWPWMDSVIVDSTAIYSVDTNYVTDSVYTRSSVSKTGQRSHRVNYIMVPVAVGKRLDFGKHNLDLFAGINLFLAGRNTVDSEVEQAEAIELNKSFFNYKLGVAYTYEFAENLEFQAKFRYIGSSKTAFAGRSKMDLLTAGLGFRYTFR